MSRVIPKDIFWQLIVILCTPKRRAQQSWLNRYNALKSANQIFFARVTEKAN